jgi:hypothetical protein
MLRKVLIVAAAVAMPVSVVGATAGSASAGAPKVDATHYTVSCTGISAKASFSPALTNAGGPVSNEATKISGKASSCTVTPTAGGTPVTVTGASIKGTINDATSSHTCGGLAMATTETGSLTIKWKTSPKLTSSTSVVNPTSVSGAVGGDGHATFSISFGTATSGPFQGTDNGTSSSTNAETTTTVTSILATCGGKSGLKSISIQPNANGGGPAIVVS